MIALPEHGCCAGDAWIAGAEPYGDLDAGNVATCALRRLWGVRDGDAPGCGARIGLCHGCGLRTRVTRPGELEAPPCEACGGTVRPSPDQMLTDRRVRAAGVDVDPTRSIVEPEAPREDVRPQESNGKPAKRRAPTKRTKRGAAESEANGLPLFK